MFCIARDSWRVVVNLIFTSTPTVYAGLEATPAFPPSEGARIRSIGGLVPTRLVGLFGW